MTSALVQHLHEMYLYFDTAVPNINEQIHKSVFKYRHIKQKNQQNCQKVEIAHIASINEFTLLWTRNTMPKSWLLIDVVGEGIVASESIEPAPSLWIYIKTINSSLTSCFQLITQQAWPNIECPLYCQAFVGGMYLYVHMQLDNLCYMNKKRMSW